MDGPSIESHVDPRRRRTRGFTLLEVMAALLVFLVGVIGILALFATAIAVHRDAMQKSRIASAADAVRDTIEEMLAEALAASDDLPVIDHVPVAGQPGLFFAATLTIDPRAGPAAGVLADVRVYTMDAGRRDGETFTVFCRPKARPEDLIREALGAREP